MVFLPESEEIDTEDLPVRMQQLLQKAELLFNTGTADSEPMAYVYGHNQTYAAFSIQDRFGTDEEKLRFGTEMSMLACNQNIEAIAVFTEADMLQHQLESGDQIPKGDLQEIMKQLLANGQTPEMCEIAIVMYEDREYSYTAMAKIHHNEDHTERYLDHWQTVRGTQESIRQLDRDQLPALQGTFAKADLMYTAMAQEERQESSDAS